MNSYDNIVERIFEVTDRGLDLICRYYPQAREVAGTKKKFRMREGDKTPSACLTLFACVGGLEKWMLTDFGGDFYAKGKDGLAVYMHEEGIEDVKTALKELAHEFGIRRNAASAKRTGEWLEALEGQQAGDFDYKTKPFTKRELRFLSPCELTTDMCHALGWESVEYVDYVVRLKNGRLKRRRTFSTDEQPIFVRKSIFSSEPHPAKDEVEHCFYKIYQPKTPDRKFWYAGEKLPADYICGEAELRRAFEANDSKPLPCAVIASGERDALCLKALGYHPLWFNSETSGRHPAAIKRLYQYVEKLYNVPDIDATGIMAGRKLAEEIPSIYTVWLPEELKERTGDQSKPMKDLRDWCGLHPDRRSFEKLMNLACTLQFWTMDKRKKAHLKPSALKTFLAKVGGFRKIVGKANQATLLVRVNERKEVELVSVEEIRSFLTYEWPMSVGLEEAVREMLDDTKVITDKALTNLEPLETDFRSSGKDHQLFFFRNCTVKVTKETIEIIDEKEKPYVWKSHVMDFNFTLMPAFFTCNVTQQGVVPHYSVEVRDTNCYMLRMFINTSRLHWMEETDYYHMPQADMARYYAENPYRLDGERLTAKQVEEQCQSFMNKVYVLGYLCHRQKSKSNARAVIAIDYRVGLSAGDCNGRSGKSCLLVDCLKTVGMNVLPIPSRNLHDINENRFIFSQVKPDTELVVFDDCAPSMDFSQFFPYITGDWKTERKNHDSQTINFSEAPKMGFTSNSVVGTSDASTTARTLEMPVSDFYHVYNEKILYHEERSIADDCDGLHLGDDDYPDLRRNLDVNFAMQCIQFYLQYSTTHPSPLKAPEGNIKLRRMMANINSEVKELLDEYFADTSHFGVEILKDDMVNWVRYRMGGKIKIDKFKNDLKSYCKCHNIIINHGDEKKRIRKRMPNGEQKECYIFEQRTKTSTDNPQEGATQQELSFAS